MNPGAEPLSCGLLKARDRPKCLTTVCMVKSGNCVDATEIVAKKLRTLFLR